MTFSSAGYNALTAKVRAMSDRFITQDQFLTLLSMPGTEEALEYLKTTRGYAAALGELPTNYRHRVNIFNYLSRSSYGDFISIYHFANQKQRIFLKQYSRRFEVILIKRHMNSLFGGNTSDISHEIDQKFFSHYTDLDIQAICRSSSVSELIQALEGTPYYHILLAISANPDAALFEYETALDQIYFSSVWRCRGLVGDKKSRLIIKEAFGSKFDLLNIAWLSRIHRSYRMNRAEIYAAIIPFGAHLSENELEALVSAPDEEAFKNTLRGTYYGRPGHHLLNPESPGEDYNRLMKNMLNTLARRMPYSIATPYRYLYLKEHEIAKLMTALECVHYHLSLSEALALIGEV